MHEAGSVGMFGALRAFLRERRPVQPGIAGVRQSIDLVGDACPTLAADMATAIASPDLNGLPLYRIAAPASVPEHVILYLHGGGYIAGSWKSHRGFAAMVAAACGATLYFPEYRLAPQHPFPAALEDAVAAYRLLLSQGARPEAIMLAGDSAGGGLTLAVAAAIRDAGLPPPAALWLLSPWADLRPRERADKGDPVLRPDDLVSAAPLYASASPRDLPGLSPATGDLSRLPPMLIHAGEAEILCEEACDLAMAVAAAGGRVTLKVAPGMVHVWPMFPAFFPAEAAQALAQAATFFGAQAARRPSVHLLETGPE